MVSDKTDCGSEALSEKDRALALDVRMAREIAEFVADRALLFDDVDSRAWALTDFGVWAVLAGRTPTLSLGPVLPPDDADESVS